jgi:N-acetylmuramate 1-kinase
MRGALSWLGMGIGGQSLVKASAKAPFMPERQQIIDAFLAGHGWGAAKRAPLADDASFRRYDRITDGERRAVLMDAPPPQEDVRPFIIIARQLRRLGYSAPAILAEDTTQGLLLLEDLGDDTYTRILAATPETEHQLYALAVDVLIDLHRRPGSETVSPELPPFDATRLLDEALLLTDWFMPAMLNAPTDAACREAFIAAWQQVLKPVLAASPTLVLRDFHVDNLIWLPHRAGVAGCGVLDFQDALAGHPAYDLMSLLEDARRDISDDLRHVMLNRYLQAFPNMAEPGEAQDSFLQAFAILAAQRHAKVIGIFTRLCMRDAKADYLVHIPRVWKLLERALTDPALAPVTAWLEAYVPASLRGVPAIAPPTIEPKMEN